MRNDAVLMRNVVSHLRALAMRATDRGRDQSDGMYLTIRQRINARKYS